MIVHRYIPYDGSENPFDPQELITKIGELMMKYQVDLDEALQLMLASGQIPNIHLKAGGMMDFVENVIAELEEQKAEILKSCDPAKNLKEITREINSLKESAEKITGKEKIDDLGLTGISDIPDFLYQLRWNLLISGKKEEKKIQKLNSLLLAMEIRRNLEKSIRLFDFSGNKKIPADKILEIPEKLFNLEDTINALKEALANGDFQALDMEKLRQALGMEKLQEFLELQKKILDRMREILEKNGFIEFNQNEPENAKITGHAIDYISSHALNEMYSHLQNDSSGLSPAETSGEGEQTTSRLRNFEFGDSVSNIDWPTTLTNAFIEKRKTPVFRDMEVYESRGSAKNSIVILLDMSGSMYRFDHFYQSKKMIFALDKYMKKENPNDRLEIIGFGSLAKRYSLNELFTLQPHPVLYSDPLIRLKVDLSLRKENSTEGIPLYFTNLQRGLSLARRILSSKETKNRQIFLITDGVPTAHMEGSVLHLNFPPVKADFEASLQEARYCREENIIINTFLLSSEWWENFSANVNENSFASKFVKATGGRFFQTHPFELGVTVLFDYISGQKKHIRWGVENGQTPEASAI